MRQAGGLGKLCCALFCLLLAEDETDNTPQTRICLFYYLNLQFARDEKFDPNTLRLELNFAI